MKQFLRYIFLLLALFMATASTWAADCTYSLDNTPSRVNVVETGKSWIGTKHYNFPNTTLCTLTNSYGISKISFNMRKDGGTNNGDFKLQYYNGSSWEDAKDASNNSITWNVKNSNTATVSREINPNSTTGKASKFQIIRTEDTNFTSSSRYFTISNIVVVIAKTLSGSEETMPFDEQVYNTTSSAKTRDFTFSNVATGKSISITNNTNATEFPAEITKNGDCTGSVTVSVKFKPSQKGTRTGQITISGDCGSKTFTVTGNGLLATPTLTLKGTTGLVDRTADVAKPNYIDLSVFIDTYIGDGYKYEVVSSNSQYAHFVGDNFYATEKGAYTIHITSPAGDHYSDTFADGKKYREIVITVRDKARPVYKANYTQSSADGMLVDGTIENAFTLTNVSNDAYFACNISVTSISNVNDGSGTVISYDAKNNKIIAHNAGTATLQFVQTENNDYYGGASPIYTFIVSKHQTSFGGEAYSMMVEGTQIANYSYSNTSSAQPTALSADDFYYTIDNVVFANEELNKGTDLITFNPSTKQITACNAGTAKITLHQKETYKYTGATASYNVTVNKYTPTFTWNAGNATYYYLSSIPNIFSTTNPDCQYTIVSDNEQVAKVIDNTLHIYNVEETANITVTQAENYKWDGKTETYTITPINPNNHVEFTITNNNHTIFEESFTSEAEWNGSAYRFGDGGWTSRTDEVVISFTGIPDTLYFDKTLEKSVGQLPGTHKCEVYESPNGNDWKLVWENDVREENTNGNKASLSPTTKYIKFYYYGTVFANYKNIRVTERREFTAIPDTVDFGVKGLNHGEQDTLITFNHINAGRITKVELIGADTSYFTVNPTTIPNTGRDQYGTTYLNITFDNKKADRGQSPYNAALRIYDNNGREEIVPLTGKRYGKSYPLFKWNPNGLPYYINSSIINIATSSNADYTNCPLTYTTSDPTIAKVENGVLYIYDKEQEVTITVSQNGNNDFYAGSSKLTFTPRRRPELVVPFHVTKDIYEKSVNPVYQCSWNETESAIQLGQNSSIFEAPAWDWNAKTALITFDGVPGKLSFKHRAINGSSTNAIWLVEQSADGYEWDEVYRETSSSTSYTNVNDIELDENTRYLRFSFSGNFGGYIKDINVSELVGYKYLRAADGHYLSRGAKWGTQAVVDAFGVVSRISRYTEDNENIYTRFFFVDNEQYMFETETADAQRLHEVFTDHGTADNTNHLWQINNNGGILTIQSANDVGVSHRGNYITAINGVLAFTTNEAEATKWQMEDYTEHPQYITDMLNRQAAAAAIKDFGQDVNTLEKVRSRLKGEDFEIHEITIPALTLGEQTGESRTVEGMPQIYEQTITGLETGFYRLTVKALYRISNSEIAWKCYQEKGKESVLAYAYANDVQYPIQSVYASYHSSAIENTDELLDGKYYPTTLSSANVAFNDANRYLNDVYVYVEADPGKTTGTLRYGIKCPSYVPGAWLAYSTITLTRFGRKEYIFHGSNSDDWETPSNWNKNSVPNQYHNVRILANATIASHAEVFSLTIDPNVSIHITTTGGLSVGANGIQGAASNGSSIVIDNLKTGAGFLRISPEYHGTMPCATINYQTRSTLDTGADKDATWQYFGAPGAGCQFTVDYITWLYQWSEPENWLEKSGTLTLAPFAGYAITQYGQPTYSLVAQPIHSNQDIVLTKTPSGMNGDNLFANSYIAPIDVKNFTAEDFSGDLDKTFYIFNSGSWNQWNRQNEKDSTLGSNGSTTPGQYCAIPALSAQYLDSQYDITTIPPMQGVYVIANENGATIHLNYHKHVWQAGSYTGSSTDMHEAMRAPQRQAQEQMQLDDFRRLRLQVNSANSGADRMYIIQESTTTRDYDNGYDAPNQLAEGIANIYTTEPFGKMEVSCANNIDSMYIGFQAGIDSLYTLSYRSIIGPSIYLKDLSNDSTFLLVEGGQYQFAAQPLSTDDMRFQVLLSPILNDDTNNNEGTTTDLSQLTNADIWFADNQLYISNAPANSTIALYHINGQLIVSSCIQQSTHTISLDHLQQGVYLLRLNHQMYKFVRQ